MDNFLIFAVNSIPYIDDFLEAMGTKSVGFGSQLFTAAYEELFINSVDLRVQYDRYYCVEYSTFQRYVELCYETELSSKDLAKRYVLQVKSPGGVLDLAYDENLTEVVLGCVRKLGETHEGQN